MARLLNLSLLLLASTPTAHAFQPLNPTAPTTAQRNVIHSDIIIAAYAKSSNVDEDYSQPNLNNNSQAPRSRRQLFRQDLPAALLATGALFISSAQPANALVKGNAPPAGVKPGGSNKVKCTNVEECMEQAERKEQSERELADTARVPLKRTKGGVIYRDEVEGTGATAKDGDDVKVYFKVLKLGKRSYDGLSGEGTVVFSRGYGFEDDEKKPGDKSFQTTIGAFSTITALNEGLPGMQVGGIRRIVVLPQKGWRKPTAMCDGGPGGEGQGGELKTDYVVVPTATMVEQEACFDTNRQPFPATFAQQRRMAQRFDQSLILEVELAAVSSSSQ